MSARSPRLVRTCGALQRVATSFVALAVVASVAQLPGCGSPQPTSKDRVARMLPPDWSLLPQSDWRFKVLEPTVRDALIQLQLDLARERQGPEYLFYGRFSEATQKRIAVINDAANASFQTSLTMLTRDLSPELENTAQTPQEVYGDWSVNRNIDMRSASDDMQRFWLMDKPSRLSPYPIMPTGGRP